MRCSTSTCSRSPGRGRLSNGDGGAWVSGSRKNVAAYFELIAAQGYTVIAVDHPGPAAAYPAALRQLNDALSTSRPRPSGRTLTPPDWCWPGTRPAQWVSQLATLTTVPRYAAELQLTPALQTDQLAGVILHCGYDDMRTLIHRGLLAPAASGGASALSSRPIPVIGRPTRRRSGRCRPSITSPPTSRRPSSPAATQIR